MPFTLNDGLTTPGDHHSYSARLRWFPRPPSDGTPCRRPKAGAADTAATAVRIRLTAPRSLLLRVVEDDAEGVALAGVHPAYPVPDVDPVAATLTFDRAVLVGKDQHLPLI